MVLNQAKFLLDENVPNQLVSIFKGHPSKIATVQQLGWSGTKNSDLAKKMNENNYILITRDKDFTFLWRKHKLKVIYIAIAPMLIEEMEEAMSQLIKDWSFDLSKPFLVVVQEETVRYWYE